MNIERMIGDMQNALSAHEDLHGCKVELMIDFGNEPKLHIGFRVPNECEAEEVLIRSAAHMLRDQMGVILDKMAEPDVENKEITKLSMAMCALSNELRCMAGESGIGRQLRMMKEVEERNDKRIREWSDEHEALCEAEKGNEGAWCARHGHCAGAECE